MRSFAIGFLSLSSIVTVSSSAEAQAPVPQPIPIETKTPSPAPQPITRNPSRPEQAPSQTNVISRLNQITERIGVIRKKIDDTKGKAMMAPRFQTETAHVNKTVNTVLADKNPEVKTLIEKREQLVESLKSTSEKDQNDPIVQKELKELQSLEHQIAPKRELAMREPTVQAKLEKLQGVLVEEMTKIEPKTSKRLDELSQLTQEYRQLQKQMK